jgi:hypothetical protein
MSLDVSLIFPDKKNETGSGIFIRENGSIKEISRDEWNEKFPGCEPAITQIGDDDSKEVYTANITHNLTTMASEAGIYQYLWRPDEINISKAGELIEPLRKGLALLEGDPERFKQFNPSNGWGDYDGLVEFVRRYLKACEIYPTADVSVWR